MDTVCTISDSRAPKRRAEHVSPFPQTSGRTSRSFAPVRSATTQISVKLNASLMNEAGFVAK